MLRIRVDDFPGTRPEEFDRHNLENFKLFDAVMRRHGASYVLGVIPRHATEEQLVWLGKQGHVELAMHGVDHDERFLDEFREWQTVEEICYSLIVAKRSLEASSGRSVSTYVPPHNVLNPRSVLALDRAGFSTVLCGPGTDFSFIELAIDVGLRVAYCPEPFFYGRSDEMLARGAPRVVREALSSCESGVDVFLTLHWTWEWNVGLGHLDALLKEFPGAFERPKE